MILATGKPKFKNRVVYLYEQTTDKLKTGGQIVYKCDVCGDINNTGSSTMMKAKGNTLKKQMCRKCRTIKSERLKNGSITYEMFKSKLEENNYKIVSTKEEFDIQLYPSQAKMKVVCNKSHKLTVTWNNFEKGKRCRQCYENNKYKNAIKYIDGFDLYKFLVNHYTKISYNKYKYIINPNKLKRGHNKYHLDHKFSIVGGFKENILPFVIGSVCNLRVIDARKNIQKYDRCSITKEQLFKQHKDRQGG